MTKRESGSKTYTVPLSGILIGTVVKEFRLQDPTLNDKTARRFFGGGRVSDRRRAEIVDALGHALTELHVFPLSGFLEHQGIDQGRVLGFAVAWYAQQWDRLAGYMRSTSASVERRDMAAAAYMRLVVIDLALRVSAGMWLAELPTPTEEPPIWAEESSGAKYLRQLLARCGPSAPTRDQLAEYLDVSYNTVDSWLDSGARPSPANLSNIANVLGQRIEGLETDILRRDLQFHYALSHICDLLSLHLGRETVMDLAAALTRFISRNLDGLRKNSRLPPEAAAQAQLILLVLGTRFVSSEFLLKALWRNETDPLWRTDLMAASKPWHLRLTYVMQNIGSMEGAVQVAQDQFSISQEEAESLVQESVRSLLADPTRFQNPHISDLESMNFVRVRGDAKFSAGNRMIQYSQARSEGDLQTALVHIRRAVELQPESAEYHFHLGATLGMAGEFEDGIHECWIAAQLDSSWELPGVEIGIILLNADRNDEALEHLESIAQGQPSLSAHLAFNLGAARYRRGMYGKALEALSTVISTEPSHARALDMAAHCAFLEGDPRLGRQLAKRAYDLGQPETYREWKAGEFLTGRRRKDNAGRRPGIADPIDTSDGGRTQRPH